MFWVAPTALLVALIPLQFEIAGLLLSPLRIFFLAITPVLIAKWASGAFGRFCAADFTIVGFGIWMSLAVLYNHGPGRMASFAGSNVLLLWGGYLCGRAAIRTAADFQALVMVLCWSIFAMLPVALYESVLLKPPPILNWVAGFDWNQPYVGLNVQERLGLNRAQVLLTHEIHYGVYCSLGLALFIVGLRNRLSVGARSFGGLLVVVATALSLSSGPFATMMMQLILVTYALAFHKVALQWKIANWCGVILYAAMEVATTKMAFIRVAELVAYSGHNAYTRSIMIDVGLDLMRSNPLFGIGLEAWPLPWWMRYSNSIDNYWLVLGGSFGAPTLLFALASFVVPMFTMGGGGLLKDGRLRKGSDLYFARVAWTIMVIGTMLSLATVHIWGNLVGVIYMMVGAGMFLIHACEPEAGTEAAGQAPAGPKRRRAYTRFPEDRAGHRAVRQAPDSPARSARTR